MSDLEIGMIKEDEIEEFASLVHQIFPWYMGSSLEKRIQWIKNLGQENIIVGKENKRVVSGLALIHMGQWFGGSRVPVAGIAAMGVSPEQRGRKLGYSLLRHVLEKLHSDNIPLALLYPSTLGFYRTAGFEASGTKVTYEAYPSSIRVEHGSGVMIAVQGDAYDEIHRIYAIRAKANSGNLDRPTVLWKKILEPENKETYRYLIKNSDQVEGYIIYSQEKGGSTIRIHDVTTLTMRSALRLLTFLSDHRAQCERVIWSGAPQGPLGHLLSERRRCKVLGSAEWAVRIVDVVDAITYRGYPNGLEAELHFEIVDNLLSWNNGRLILTVSKGKPTMRKGGKGKFRVDARGLSALYTGYLTPHELQVLGHIEAERDDIDISQLIFCGNRPWMSDFF